MAIHHRLLVLMPLNAFDSGASNDFMSSRLQSLLLVATLFCARESLAQQRVLTRMGESHAGQLAGTSPDTLRFVWSEREGATAISDVRRIDVAPSSFVLPISGPTRTFSFWGAERLFGELRGWNTETVVARLGSLGVRTFSNSALSAIGNVEQESDVAYEPFERLPTIWQSSGAEPDLDGSHHRSGESALLLRDSWPEYRYTLDHPLTFGRVCLWYRNADPESDLAQWSIHFEFESATGRQHVSYLLQAGDRSRLVEASPGIKLRVQSVPRSTRWHKLSVLMQESGLRILRDGMAVASTARLNARLVGVRVGRHAAGRARPTSEEGETKVWVDDFVLTRFTAPRETIRAARKQDVVVTLNGDELYGELENVDATSVTLNGTFGSVRLAWNDVIGCYPQLAPTASGWVAGLLARVGLQSPVDIPHGSKPTLIGAILSSDARRLEVDHPFLGRLRIPFEQIARIEPIFRGSSRLLSPETQHLGDEARPDFRMPQPVGSRLTRFVRLEQLPEGSAFLSAEVAELEPSGPGTPPASPFLADLRNGFLKTGLWINDHHVADLNDHISTRRQSGDPQRIRIPIPPGVLKTGDNSYRFEQRPSRRDPNDFDDFEIRRIALEIQAD